MSKVVEIILLMLEPIISLFGKLFVWLVSILVSVASFNNFINLEMVKIGWSLTRDVANMFFIVVLLIIAFSTILKIQSYHYQRTLVKLVIMAVLINFSKLIAGFLIDFFQVIMLTFVNGFKDVAAGNFADAFGIYQVLSFAQGDADLTAGEGSTVVAATLLAIFMIIVADIVLLILIAVLLYRIAMLWVLVIISPLAYLAYAISPKYWSQWWSMFFQHLISGPVIAFFLWLALLTVQKGNISNSFVVGEEGKVLDNQDFGTAVSASTLLSYMVTVALFMGGLAISQKMAQQSGGVVGNFAQKVQKYGMAAASVATGAFLLKKPVDAVAGRVKTFQQLRQAEKQTKYADGGRRLYGAYSKLRQNTVGEVGKGMLKLGSVITGQRKRDELLVEENQARSDLERFRGMGIDVDKRGSEIDESLKQKKAEMLQLAQGVIDKDDIAKLENENDVTKIAETLSSLLAEKKETATSKDEIKNIQEKENNLKKMTPDIKSLAEERERISRVQRLPEIERKRAAKDFQAFIMGAIGAVTLGPLARRMAQSGERGVQTIKEYELSQIEKSRSTLKGTTDHEVEMTLKDPSVDAYKRAAAVFEHIQRGNGKANEVELYRNIIASATKGDETVMNHFNKLVEKYLPGALPETPTSTKDRVRQGAIDYSSMDTESWRKLLPSILKGLEMGGNFYPSVLVKPLIQLPLEKQAKVLDYLEDVHKNSSDQQLKDRAAETLFVMGDLARINWNDPGVTSEKVGAWYYRNQPDAARNLIRNANQFSLIMLRALKRGLKASDFKALFGNIKKLRSVDESGNEVFLGKKLLQDSINEVQQTASPNTEQVELTADLVRLTGDLGAIERITDSEKREKVVDKVVEKMSPSDFGDIEFSKIDSNIVKEFFAKFLQKKHYPDIEQGLNQAIKRDGGSEDAKVTVQTIVKMSKEGDEELRSKAENILQKANKNPNSRIRGYLDVDEE